MLTFLIYYLYFVDVNKRPAAFKDTWRSYSKLICFVRISKKCLRAFVDPEIKKKKIYINNSCDVISRNFTSGILNILLGRLASIPYSLMFLNSFRSVHSILC